MRERSHGSCLGSRGCIVYAITEHVSISMEKDRHVVNELCFTVGEEDGGYDVFHSQTISERKCSIRLDKNSINQLFHVIICSIQLTCFLYVLAQDPTPM